MLPIALYRSERNRLHVLRIEVKPVASGSTVRQNVKLGLPAALYADLFPFDRKQIQILG